MRKMMLGLLVLMAVVSAKAEMVFDLGAQQFYYPITRVTDTDGNDHLQFVEASYDTGKAIVSTGLASVDGYYRPADYKNGYFGVKIKKPKARTAIAFSMYCYLHVDGCSIEMVSNRGSAFTLDFSDKKISVDGKVMPVDYFHKGTNINGSIEVDPEQILITINGRYVFTLDRKDFILFKLNISLYTERDYYRSHIDKLMGLTVSNNSDKVTR